MAFPEPQPGLIISYAYLWRHEHGAGREEDVKDRPCVPVTHSPPDNPATAVELPHEFTRPGFDLRPLPRSRDLYNYGFLPPRLFNALMAKLAEV